MSFFPLFCLAEDSLLLTLSFMESLELLTLSLCSKKSRKLIASLQLESFFTCITIGETASLNIAFHNKTEIMMHFNSRRSENNTQLITEIQVDTVEVEFGAADEIGFLNVEELTSYTWTKPEWSFEDWAELIIEIFGVKFGAISFDTESQIYDLPSLKLQLESLHENVVLVQEECPKSFHQMVYATFQPLNGVCISTNPYPDVVTFQRLLHRNFNYIEVNNECPATLEELLITNSKSLELYNCVKITVKDINKFIRLWQKGSNRAMIFMAIRMPIGKVLEVEKVLKGTKYQVVSEKRELKLTSEKYVEFTVTGGYDVRGKNGIVATVKIVEKNERHCLEFYVWH